MPSQILKFGGVDLSPYIETWQEKLDTRLNAVTVPNRAGVLFSSARVLDARRIDLTGRIVSPDGTALGLRTTLDTLSNLFNQLDQQLQLWDDRYITATKATFGFAYVPGSAMRVVDFQVSFLCADPFTYSTSGSTNSYNLTTGDVAIDITNNIYRQSDTLNYTGTFLTFPVYTITAGATPLTHITIRNLTIGRQFVYSGTVAPTKSLVVDTANFLVTNDGTSDLTNWNGDFIWLQPGNNSLQFEGTTPATYALSFPIRYN